MLIKVKTYRPIRRFILIRFTFPVLSVCLLTIILFGIAIWVDKTCNREESVWIPPASQKAYNLEERRRINEAKSCFWPSTNRLQEGIELLEDVLEAETKPSLGKSVFFHETTCLPRGIVQLNARQACAIESAAKWNPNRDVFLTFASPAGFLDAFIPPTVRALYTYPNIHLRNLNFTTYAEATPMEPWFHTDQLFLSKYLNSHTSDFLRYTSMFKFGGIYLDLDVIVQQSFDTLPPNFVGAESTQFVGVGAMGFQQHGLGHEIANLCVEEFTQGFHGDNWGYNGPGVLTRVLRSICDVKYTMDMTPEKCWGFEVLPRTAFYAIRSKAWRMFFDPKTTQAALDMTRNSIIVHVWNKHSSNRSTGESNEKTAYEIIASRNCPRVYEASDGDI